MRPPLNRRRDQHCILAAVLEPQVSLGQFHSTDCLEGLTPCIYSGDSAQLTSGEKKHHGRQRGRILPSPGAGLWIWNHSRSGICFCLRDDLHHLGSQAVSADIGRGISKSILTLDIPKVSTRSANIRDVLHGRKVSQVRTGGSSRCQ